MFNNTFFLTATINNWKPLLIKKEYKEIILSTLRFLSQTKGVKILSYVIMPNHIHLIWNIPENQTKGSIQGSLLRFSAQQIKFNMLKSDKKLLEEFKVDAKDREYQIWKRNPLSVEIYTDVVCEQKLNYIHNNPINKKWSLSITKEDYFYSSAAFYETGIDDFGFLTNVYLE